VSIDFRGLKPRSDDPLAQVFTELQKKVAKFITSQQTDLIDSDNEDIYTDGQDMDSVIKYHSELSSQQLFSFDKKFFPPSDAVMVKGWWRSLDLGNEVKDRSSNNHTAQLYGDPTLVDGTIDLGIHTKGTKSIARRMNRPTSEFQNLEWMQIPDHADFRISSLTTGISIFTRVRFQGLDVNGNRDPTIFEKLDDSTPNNAYMLQAKSDGRLVFIVKKGGTTYAKETTAPTVASGAVYDIWAVFDIADNSIHIYVDGTERAVSNFAGTVNWQTTLTNHDLFVFRRGLGDDGGFVYGDFYDLKYYPEYVVSNLDVQYHFNNKWTITNIPFGHVMITNYWATFGTTPATPLCSFSESSFTTTSFNVCIGGGGGGGTTICSFSEPSFTTSFNVCVGGGGGGGGTTPGDAFDDIAFDEAAFD